MCSSWHVSPPLNKINFCNWQLINSCEHSRPPLSKARLEKHQVAIFKPIDFLLDIANQSRPFPLFFSPHLNSLLITGILPPRDVQLDQIHGIWKMRWVHGLLVKTSQGSCQMSILQHFWKSLYIFRRMKIISNSAIRAPLQWWCMKAEWVSLCHYHS